MRSLLIFILTSVILVLIYFKVPTNFQEAFWPNFWADLIVATIFGIIISQLTDLVKKPKLSLVVKQNGFYRDTILLTKEKNGLYTASFTFAIKNSGNKTLKGGEGYWNTYLDMRTVSSNFKYLVAGEPAHQRDLIRYSIYPKSSTDILDFKYDLSVKKEDVEKAFIPYMFQTDYGNFPKAIKWNPDTGAAPVHLFGKIKLILPD
jgi:hypothetical protein